MKYRLDRNATKTVGDRTLYQIVALKDFIALHTKVKQNEKGGYIEKENNLSQKGECWIFHNGNVYGDASIQEDALIYGGSIYNKAIIKGRVHVYQYPLIGGSAILSDNVTVHNQAQIGGNAKIYENALITGVCMIGGNSKIYGHAQITDRSTVMDDAEIFGDGILTNSAKAIQNARIDTSVRYGIVCEDITKNIVAQIDACFGILPIDGVYTIVQSKESYKKDPLIVEIKTYHKDSPKDWVIRRFHINDIKNTTSTDNIDYGYVESIILNNIGSVQEYYTPTQSTKSKLDMLLEND